ncbi:MAG: hypothetical protein MJ052_01405 [Sphaerochaetaceae bacterium]|nr:hypothetical protein [Sphaerochaetaceae bacterium]
MTDEEKAEEYLKKNKICNNENWEVGGTYCYALNKQSYLDGLAEGKPKWHDLRKNPDDLPKERGDYLILHEDNTGFTHYSVRDFRNGYFECTNTIIAWCELPKFKE